MPNASRNDKNLTHPSTKCGGVETRYYGDRI